MEKLLLIFGMLVFITTGVFAQGVQTNVYKGDYIIMGAVVISSMGITTTGSAIATTFSNTPIISSATYTGKLDWVAWPDSGGSDVYVSSYPSINTAKLENVKLRPGEPLKAEGRLTASFFGVSLAGSSNLTTFYYVICGKN